VVRPRERRRALDPCVLVRAARAHERPRPSYVCLHGRVGETRVLPNAESIDRYRAIQHVGTNTIAGNAGRDHSVSPVTTRSRTPNPSRRAAVWRRCYLTRRVVTDTHSRRKRKHPLVVSTAQCQARPPERPITFSMAEHMFALYHSKPPVNSEQSVNATEGALTRLPTRTDGGRQQRGQR
jgi:hypothetical protein